MSVRIAHHTPGRVRLKVPSAKGQPGMLDEIKNMYCDLPGVESVKFNSHTGSVILQYDIDQRHEFQRSWANRRQFNSAENWPNIDGIDNIAKRIESEANFLAENSELARLIVDFFKGVDDKIKIASDNFVDLEILLAIGIVGFTVLEVGATASTPIWVTIAVFGLHHFIEIRQAQHPGSTVAAIARP